MASPRVSLRFWAFLAALAALLALHPLHAAGKAKGNTKERTELRFWHSIGSYNKDVLNSIIDSYNKSNKDIRVMGSFQGTEEEVYRKLQSLETLPDVVLVPVQFLPSAVDKSILAEMGPYIQNKVKDGIADKFWESVSIDGKIYGMPFSYNVNILLVNQHILRMAGVRQDREPVTWNEIFEIARKIRENTGEKWGLYVPMENAAQFAAFTQSHSGKQFSRDLRIDIASAEATGAMQALQDAVYDKTVMPARVTAEEAERLFLSGNIGIMMASSASLVYIESNLPYDLGVWHLPSNRSAPPLATGSCLSILKAASRREKDAFKFVDFLTGDDNAINWHTHTGSPAIRTNVRDSLDLLIFYEESPNHTTSAVELDRARIFNPPLDFATKSGFAFDYLGFNRIVKRALDEIMINGKQPAEALPAAQRELEPLLGPK